MFKSSLATQHIASISNGSKGSCCAVASCGFRSKSRPMAVPFTKLKVENVDMSRWITQYKNESKTKFENSNAIRVGHRVYLPGYVVTKGREACIIMVYDSIQDAWTREYASGNSRNRNNSFVYDDKILLFGRQQPARAIPSKRKVEMTQYDILTREWSTFPTTGFVPFADIGPTRDYIGELDKYVVFGGCHMLGRIGLMHILDMKCLVWQKPVMKGKVPKGRVAHASCVHDGAVYYYGGGENFYGPTAYISVMHLSVMNVATWSQPRWAFGPSNRLRSCLFSYQNVILQFGIIYVNLDGLQAKVANVDDPNEDKMIPLEKGYNVNELAYFSQASVAPFEFDRSILVFGMTSHTFKILRISPLE